MAKDTKKSSPTSPESSGIPVRRELHPIENFYRLFDDFFVDRWMPRPGLLRHALAGNELFAPEQPQVDIIDGENDVSVTANLPGVDKENIDVTVTENSLTIRASKKEEKEQKDGEYFRREISRGEISRTLALPCEVDSEKTTAVYTDGVLKLSLPKVRSTKRHSVKIQ